MKKRTNTYREVQKLPASAMTVPTFAAQMEYANPGVVYNNWRRSRGPTEGRNQIKINFEIVVFKGINFVIPKKQKASV